MNQGHGDGKEGGIEYFFYENLDSQDKECYRVRAGTVKGIQAKHLTVVRPKRSLFRRVDDARSLFDLVSSNSDVRTI